MRPPISGLVLTFLLPLTAAAQQIRGVVVEDSTGYAVSDVTIEVIDVDTVVRATTISSSVGWFELSPRGTGTFLLIATHPAYRVAGTLVVNVAADDIVTVVLRVSGGPIPLAPLIVRGRAVDRLSGFRERMRRNASGRFITRADLDKLGAHSPTHALRLAPEVRIERVRDGPFTSDGMFMRSYGSLCVPAVYLNGHFVPPGFVSEPDFLIGVGEIEGIEVYRSAISAPAEFRTPAFMAADFDCGVIALWGRPLPSSGFPAKGFLLSGVMAGTVFLVSKVLR